MIAFGSNNINKAFLGSLPVEKMYLGSIEIYSSAPQLAAPQNVSVTGTEASFDGVENAESYEFFVDGTSIGEYEVPSVTLIDFTVTKSSVTWNYQAEDGMTWGNWVSSEYNTGGYFIFNNMITNDISTYVSTMNLSPVLPTDVIVNGYSYIIAGGND